MICLFAEGSRSTHHKSSGVKGHQQVNPVGMSLASSQPFPAGGTIALAQPNRLLTSQSLSALYGGQVLTTSATGGHFSHIQIQPKQGGGKTVTAGKLAMQPMQLTIPIVAPGMTVAQQQQQQARALLLQGEDRQKHSLSQQMQNSPSNMIS